MARVLILGGGFGGVVAAESLVKQLGDDHQITLVSRTSQFLFYPALVRLAFGKCEPDDVSFDLRMTMLHRRVSFVEAEVARIEPADRKVILAHGEVEGSLTYDYLIYALGRRLATERVTGFFENGHHLLDLDGAMRFGEAVRHFKGGQVLIGQCPDARLPVPVYETAFAFSRWLEENGDPARTSITIVSPSTIRSEFDDDKMAATLTHALERRSIQHLSEFPIARISPGNIASSDGRDLNYHLLMLLPPFSGSSAASHLGITDDDNYINVDWTMKVLGTDRMYAIGDCVNLAGPKLAHMAVNQAEVAAANVAAEIAGDGPVAHYQHDLQTVIESDGQSIYFHKDLWSDDAGSVRQGRFWRWAKRVHEKYWEATHA